MEKTLKEPPDFKIYRESILKRKLKEIEKSSFPLQPRRRINSLSHAEIEGDEKTDKLRQFCDADPKPDKKQKEV